MSISHLMNTQGEICWPIAGGSVPPIPISNVIGLQTELTNLQNEINLTVPYTGATGNVNLGAHNLTASGIDISTMPTGAVVSIAGDLISVTGSNTEVLTMVAGVPAFAPASGGGTMNNPSTANLNMNGFDINSATSIASTSLINSGATNLTANLPQIIDKNSNVLVTFAPTASAVNSLTIQNQATGFGPAIGVSGSDANINLNLDAKGTGNVTVNANELVNGNLQTTGNGIIGGTLQVVNNTTLDGTLTIPTFATEGVLITNSSGNVTDLTVGSNGQVLTVASGLPAWVTSTNMLYEGIWSSSVTYAIGNVVLYNGSSYVSTINGNLNNNPVVSTSMIWNGDTPTSLFAGPIEIGIAFTLPSVGGIISGLAFYQTTTLTGTVDLNLWNFTTMANIYHTTYATTGTNGWIVVDIPSQVFSSAIELVVSYGLTSSETFSYSSTAPSPTGGLVYNSSSYSNTVNTFPNVSYGGGYFMADIVFQETSEWALLASGGQIVNNASGFTVYGGVMTTKNLTVDNNLTLVGVDGSTLNVSSGGTLVASAFTDTTNASNISSGTLANARLPSNISVTSVTASGALIGGSMQDTAFSSAGVVHNDASGNLTSSLIVNNDITNGTIQGVKLATSYLPLAGGTMSGAINMSTNNISNVNALTTVSEQITGLSTGVVHSNVSGNLTSSLIVNSDITAGTITSASLATPYLPLAGGAMSGAIDMTTNNINNIGDCNMDTLNFTNAGGGFIKTNFTNQIILIPTGSADNYLQFQNAIGPNGPTISSTSLTNTSIPLTLSALGTSNIILATETQFNSNIKLMQNVTQIEDAGNNNLLTLTKTSSAVNYLGIQNNSTNNPPIISALGSDTNINLELNSKGNAGVYIKGRTDGGAVPAGYVGEIISVSTSLTISYGTFTYISNNAASNIQSITITPGNWYITGFGGISNYTGGTLSNCVVWLQTTSTPTIPPQGTYTQYGGATGSGGWQNNTLPIILYATTSTTIYLNCYVSGSNASLIAAGQIIAQRFS